MFRVHSCLSIAEVDLHKKYIGTYMNVRIGRLVYHLLDEHVPLLSHLLLALSQLVFCYWYLMYGKNTKLIIY